MATKYATLKDSNGDTIYPQISSDSISNGSITSSKIDWTTTKTNYVSQIELGSASFTWAGDTRYAYKLSNGQICLSLPINNVTAAANATFVVATIPSELTPSPSNISVGMAGGATSQGYTVWITPTGEIRAKAIASVTNAEFRLVTTYFQS